MPSRALEELQDSGAFRAAVLAIVKESKTPNAPRGIDRALELLRQGETGAAQIALAEILDRRLRERATASAEAAEAARNLGAIAYLNNTAKAIEAYQTATDSIPTTPGRGFSSAACISEQATWLPPSRHFRGPAKRPSAPAMTGTSWSPINSLGDVRVARGDLSGAAAAYEAGLEAAKQTCRAGPEQHRMAARPLGQLQQDRRRAERAGQSGGGAEGLPGRARHPEKLAAQDPSNTEWQRDLSVSFNRIGDVLCAQGNLDAALEAYQDRLGITETGRAGPEQHRVAARPLGQLREDRRRAERAGQSGGGAAGLPGRARHRREAGRAGPEQHRMAARPLGQLQQSATCRARGAIWRRRCRPTRTGSPSPRSWPRRTRATPNGSATSRSASTRSATCRARGAIWRRRCRPTEDGLAIAEKLAAQDPSNTGWQRDLPSVTATGRASARGLEAAPSQQALEIRPN